MKFSRKKSYPLFFSGFFWIGALIFVFILVNFAGLLSKKREIDEEIIHSKNEITEISKNNKNILEFIDYLNSDMFVEEEAREKFNLAAPGEKVVIITDDDKNKSGNNVNEENVRLRNPERWWKYFFH